MIPQDGHSPPGIEPDTFLERGAHSEHRSAELRDFSIISIISLSVDTSKSSLSNTCRRLFLYLKEVSLKIQFLKLYLFLGGKLADSRRTKADLHFLQRIPHENKYTSRNSRFRRSTQLLTLTVDKCRHLIVDSCRQLPTIVDNCRQLSAVV